MILLAPDTERIVLGTFASLLAPGGRVLVGYNLKEAPTPFARDYPVAAFTADVEAAGLEVEQRFASYALRPYDDDGSYAVHVLRRRA
jgi:hypothetical protein